jgi:phospholipase A1/A2
VRSLIILSLILLYSTLAFADEGWFTQRRGQYDNLLKSKYSLPYHKGSFIMPVVYNWSPNEKIYTDFKAVEPENAGNAYYEKVEAEFQMSFLLPAYRNIGGSKQWDLFFGYTHHAWWQVYNDEWSQPFRETNYTPELFTRYMPEKPYRFFSSLDFSAFDIGYMHNSNGQIKLLSRSWDRIVGRTFVDLPFVSMIVSGWYRVPKSSRTDQNKDIHKYMGYGDVEFIKVIGKHSFNISTQIGAERFGSTFRYSYPWKDGFRWLASFDGGYGRSLIEYNESVQRFGIGIALENFLDNGPADFSDENTDVLHRKK